MMGRRSEVGIGNINPFQFHALVISSRDELFQARPSLLGPSGPVCDAASWDLEPSVHSLSVHRNSLSGLKKKT